MPNSEQPISDAEKELGAHWIPFNFGQHMIRGMTLARLLEQNTAVLLDLSRWGKLERLWPQTYQAVNRFCAVPRVAQILQLVSQQQADQRQKPRCKTRISNSYAQRERQELWGE